MDQGQSEDYGKSPLMDQGQSEDSKKNCTYARLKKGERKAEAEDRAYGM